MQGQVRRRSVYASRDEVTLGVLTYEDLVSLRRERPQISDLVVPYANTMRTETRPLTETREAPNRASDSAPKATLLDCHPELELLQAELNARLEAMQVTIYIISRCICSRHSSSSSPLQCGD